MEKEKKNSLAAPPFMGQEIEWAVLVKDARGKYRLPSIWELQSMINVFRAYLKYPLITEKKWDGALEETGNLKTDKEWLKFLKERNLTAEYFDLGILPCGFRYYIDCHHLELSTPGCSSVRDLLISDKAAEEIVNISCRLMENGILAPGDTIRVFKDTSNRKGTSFAGHENYLVERSAFEKMCWDWKNTTMQLASFFALRVPLIGAGKAGAENGLPQTFFQISQRADWIERMTSVDTTFSRPIVNLRDEPHAHYTTVNGKKIYLSRLHVICGDPNMSPSSTKIKFGFTSNFLMGLQDGVFENIRKDIVLANPVRAIKIISRDLRSQKTIEMADGRQAKFYEVLRVINDRLRWYFANMREPSAEQIAILEKVEYYCDCFAKGPKHYLQILLPELDWINRMDVCLSAIEDNSDFSSFDKKTWRHLYYNDLCYADINPNRSLYYQRERHYREEDLIKEEISREEILDRVFNPPKDNREYLRGEILKKFPAPNTMADWGLVRFYNPNFSQNCPAWKIWLFDPFRGGISEIGDIVKNCKNEVELYRSLKQMSFEIEGILMPEDYANSKRGKKNGKRNPGV